jgi:tetratricopeptide (TPR) repeat protein
MQTTCPECRKSNLVTNRFCWHCGALLAPARVAPEAEAKPTQQVMAESHLQQAEALVGVHEHERALEECGAAIRLWPDLVGAHNLRGAILDELGRQEEAVLAYSQALHLEARSDTAAENLPPAGAEAQPPDVRQAARPQGQPTETTAEEPAEPPASWVRILIAPLAEASTGRADRASGSRMWPGSGKEGSLNIRFRHSSSGLP